MCRDIKTNFDELEIKISLYMYKTFWYFEVRARVQNIKCLFVRETKRSNAIPV